MHFKFTQIGLKKILQSHACHSHKNIVIDLWDIRENVVSAVYAHLGLF